MDPNGGANVESDDQLAVLTARVAALERQVAQLLRTAPAGEPAVTISPAPKVEEQVWRPAASFPMVPPRVPPPPPPVARPEISLESRLGSQVFNMIGIVAIIIGTSWFLKMAIERGWIGPVARVLIGLGGGAGLVLWSETFRRKGLAAFSYSLKAIGSAILYLALWAGFQLYHLLPAGVALAAMVLVTAWNGFMAWSQDSEVLAGYGLLGGFGTPLLLSTGGNHEAFLFTYIAAIDAATILLLRWKPWRRLLLPALAATAAFFIGWYSEYFQRADSSLRGVALPGQWNAESTATSAFIVLFFAMFAAVSMKGFRRTVTGSAEVVVPVLVPLANAAWISLAMYSVLQDSGLHAALAWMMVALAALYLGLMRLQESAVATAVHLACAVVFLTIAIPLKASGHSLTTAWLVEGLALYWASTRVEGESGAPGRALSVLALGAYCLGLLSLSFHWFWMPVAYLGFFNANLGAAMIAAGSLAGLGWLASRSQEGEKPAILLTALVAINLVALLLVCGEISASSYYVQHAAFANVPFATSLVGLAILAGVAWVAYRLSETAGAACASVAGVTLVLFNLGAILSVEREIGALWSHSDAELARSLAISGFLMLYGAILLAAGFWKRSEFVRWQALILLIFTIGKVFFYDISGLSQGYRVASFLALGALLMGVSLAYQKDWLGLRATAAHPPKADE